MADKINKFHPDYQLGFHDGVKGLTKLTLGTEEEDYIYVAGYEAGRKRAEEVLSG